MFICVNTPAGPDGDLVLDDVKEAIEQVYRPDRTVVIASTLPVGGFAKIGLPGLVYNPLFIALGNAVWNMTNAELLLVGCRDRKLAEPVLNIWVKVMSPHTPKVHVVSPEEAEVIKLALNVYLTMKVSLSSMLLQVCEASNMNIDTVLDGLLCDSRVDHNYFGAGIGYSGACFPKDLAAFHHFLTSQGHRSLAKFTNGIRSVNEHVDVTLKKAVEEMAIKDLPVSILGLAYKPRVPYVEESKGVKLAAALASSFEVRTWDPLATVHVPGTHMCQNMLECLKGSGLAVVTLRWPGFNMAPWFVMSRPAVLDCWGIVSKTPAIVYRRLGVHD